MPVPGILEHGAKATETIGAITILDERARSVVPDGAKIERLTEDRFAWSEGPVWIMDGNFLLFTDVPGNTIYRWSREDGLTEFMHPSGYGGPDGGTFREAGANGLVRSGDGGVFMGDHGNRAIARLDLEAKTKTFLIQRFQGRRFNSPNDLVLAADGSVYFTDPPYGLKGLDASPVKELPFNGVYHLSAVEKVHGKRDIEIIEDELTRPNGIILSPDGRTLYVAVSDPNHAKLYRYRLDPAGKPKARDVFYDFTPRVAAGLPGLPDGMAIDTAGRLFVAGPGGIHVIHPDGTLLAILSTGVAMANCTFGEDGQTLFMTSGAFLARIRLHTTGLGFE